MKSRRDRRQGTKSLGSVCCSWIMYIECTRKRKSRYVLYMMDWIFRRGVQERRICVLLLDNVHRMMNACPNGNQ